NLLEEGPAPVYFQRLISEVMAVERDRPTSMDCIDSRLTLTAAKANRWIPIRPGTYGALALGVAHVLIVDRLYDRDFVRRNCHGYGAYTDASGGTHQGFEAFVRAEYYPDRVAEITGIPATTIIELGERFGRRRPSVAISGGSVDSATNGAFSQWAVYCLNALVGNIQEPGGVYFQPTSILADLPWEAEGPRLDRSAPTQLGTGAASAHISGAPGVDQFFAAVAASDEPLIDTLVLVGANPLYHSRQKATVRQALEKIERIVVLGTIMDETAQHATLFLPLHHWLESRDVGGPAMGTFFDHVGYQQPAIPPMFDTRSAGDILIAAGRESLGANRFPWPSYDKLVDAQLQSLLDSGRGAVVSEEVDVEWLAQMRARGWQLQQYDDFDEFKALLEQRGGWWDPIMPTLPKARLYTNRSGKFEFVSSFLEEQLGRLGKPSPEDSEGERDQTLALRGISARGDELLQPHHEEPLYDEPDRFPLVLTTSWPLTNREGNGASQPSMLEMVGIQSHHHWESWVVAGPTTIREYGLKDRQQVWVESPLGRVQARLSEFAAIRPGVVHLQLGLGHTSLGRFAAGVGVNATDIIHNRFDVLTGAPALNGTRVRLSAVLKGV
ncbi:MAG: molybdopterin-dependent oxidoreductase, partial [Candidatus Neomarinimicrobiota bacterium]